MIDNEKECYIKKLIRYFNSEGLRYCIVGDLDDFPSDVVGDIDIVTDNRSIKMINHFIRRFCQDECGGDLFLVQSIQHEATAFYFVLVWFDLNGKPQFIHPDICSDYCRDGNLLICDEEILSGQREVSIEEDDAVYFIPKNEIAFLYYLLKKVSKGELTDKQWEYLIYQWEKMPQNSEGRARKYFSEYCNKVIFSAIKQRNIDSMRSSLPELKKSLLSHVSVNPSLFLGELNRKIGRFLHPTGVSIAILGPDGSGKSSLIDQVIRELGPAFRKTRYFHLRPKLFGGRWQKSPPITDPHGQPLRGYFSSIAKVFFFLFDYLLGYLVKIRPLLVCSTLVVFDRYYHDILVDHKRYRYSGPRWLPRCLAAAVPEPDIVILLNAPAEVSYARKQEVSLIEVKRQVKAYREELKSSISNLIIIDATQSLDQVVLEVNSAVLDFMKQRLESRIG